ncbi:MAG: hypothetical protein IJY96_05130 [Oscillospiraceae bacterium]|nr:hypothetical protein [Oscillospiraceae bacterium]
MNELQMNDIAFRCANGAEDVSIELEHIRLALGLVIGDMRDETSPHAVSKVGEEIAKETLFDLMPTFLGTLEIIYDAIKASTKKLEITRDIYFEAVKGEPHGN